MFLVHTLGIFAAIYTMSAILAEIIFSSELEKKLPTAVRIGFSYLLSLIYFSGAWLLMSIRQAWVLGLLLLISYTYGKFGNIFKPFDGAQFKQLLKKHLQLLSVFLILANLFFLPMHWDRQYGPFARVGGDIIHHSDPAKKLDDFNLSAASFEEGASFSKRLSNIKHMLNLTFTDDFLALPPESINPPDADYQATIRIFSFNFPYQVFTPSTQFHFLSGATNYPAHFAVMAFVYTCFITSVFGFFRAFGRVPAIFSILVFTSSQTYIAAFYNHFLFQNLSSMVLALVLGAVLHVRLFSLTGLKTYITGISICWFTNYNHYIPILLPLFTLASLHRFYPVPVTPKQQIEEPKKNGFQKLSFFTGCGSLTIFGLMANWIVVEHSLTWIKSMIGVGTGTKPMRTGESIPVFSEHWWAQTYGFVSHYDLPPFVLPDKGNKLVEAIFPLGITAAFIVSAAGLAMVVMSRLKPHSISEIESNKKLWHLIGIYSALISTVLLYAPIGQGGAYFQLKSSHYLLPCVYFIMLLPLVIFFRSNKNFLIFFRNGKKSSGEFIIAASYMISLVCFAVTLMIPRWVSLERFGNQEDSAVIIHPSFFSEAKRITSEDDKAFVLFEPRKPSDTYFGNQPFSDYRVVPIRYASLPRYDNPTEASKGIYVDAPPSDFIEPNDLPHLWSLWSKDKINWQAEKLVFRESPNLYFTGNAYEKNYGLKHRMSRLNPSFDSSDQGMFSYIRNGTAMVYLPPGGPYDLEVKVMHRDETNKEKYDLMAEEIESRAKAGKFKSLNSINQDGPILTMKYQFEKSDSSRLSPVCRYDSEYWFSARLDGKDIVAE